MKAAQVALVLALLLGLIAVWNLAPSSTGAEDALSIGKEPSPDGQESPSSDEVLSVPERPPIARDEAAEAIPVPSTENPRTSTQVDPEALPPLVIPEGTVLIGRLLDRQGAPVEEANLRLRRSGVDLTIDSDVFADAEGRFVCPLKGVSGDVTLTASASGIGQSADLAIFLPEGRATDVGDLRLEGDGVIRGHLRFPDGSACPGVYLTANAVDSLTAPGLKSSAVTTADDGSFGMTALAQGRFRFDAARDGTLPLVGSDVLQVGVEDAELIVHAALLVATCVNESGEEVPLTAYELSDVVDTDLGRKGPTGSTSSSFSTAQESIELMIPIDESFLLEAYGEDRASYLAYLQHGTLSPGIHAIELRRDPPTLGGLRLTSSPGSLPEGARATIDKIERDGFKVMGTILSGRAEPGALQLEMRGLVPGAYSVVAKIENGDWTAFKEPAHGFDLAAGETEEIHLETWEGGKLELTVQHQLSSDPPKMSARVQIRRAGEAGWYDAPFLSKRGRSRVRGANVWIDGTLATSNVLQPGSYDLKVEAEGFRTEERRVTVPLRAAVAVDIALRQED